MRLDDHPDRPGVPRRESSFSLHFKSSKESAAAAPLRLPTEEQRMDAIARMTSKGQVTVPKAVREALGLGTGDAVLFRVEDGRAVVTRIPSIAEVAGTVPVPDDVRGMPWDEVRAAAERAAALDADTRWRRGRDQDAAG